MVLEQAEEAVHPADVEFKQVEPKLTLLTSDPEEITSIEHKAELDTLTKFQKDFGLADDGKALDTMAEHNTPAENAVSFVKATIANETYLAALDHIQDADKHSVKPGDLVDLQLLRKGDASALLESEKPNSPKLKEGFDQTAQSTENLKGAMKEGYTKFYEQMTGLDVKAINAEYEDALHELRNIKTVNSAEETSLVDQRAKLDYELRGIATPMIKTTYDGIVVSNPVGIVCKVAFNASQDASISASEFKSKFDGLKRDVQDLKAQNDSIKPDSINHSAKEPRKTPEKASLIGDIIGLFKRKAK